jgi:septal ring factor EnvC (AmiA/AmiB activator)
LTLFRGRLYDGRRAWRTGVDTISDSVLDASDDHGPDGLGRLERAVVALVDRLRKLDTENATLRARLADRNARVDALEQSLREQNQRRQDVLKRIDELIGRIEQLDGHMASAPDRAVR